MLVPLQSQQAAIQHHTVYVLVPCLTVAVSWQMGKPCIEALNKEAVQAMKCDTNGLSHDELDMVMGQLATSSLRSSQQNYFSFQRPMHMSLHITCTPQNTCHPLFNQGPDSKNTWKHKTATS